MQCCVLYMSTNKLSWMGGKIIDKTISSIRFFKGSQMKSVVCVFGWYTVQLLGISALTHPSNRHINITTVGE